MAAGRPTVSNRTGDLINLFEKHKIGFLASDNPDDLAAKTLHLLDHVDLCSEMGHNARQTAEKYYDWVLLANRLEGCFNDVINEHRQSLHVRI